MTVTTAPDTLAERSTAAPLRPSHKMVLDILIARQRHGQAELTASEIREALEQIHAPRRFDKGWVTGRLDEMRDAGLVQQSEERKLNPLTGKTSHLWFIPLRQARLCA